MEKAYPNNEQLRKITNWDYQDLFGLMKYIELLWSTMGRFSQKGDCYELATGGWSGNEKIIDVLQKHEMFWTLAWQRSERGGLFVFKIPTIEGREQPLTGKQGLDLFKAAKEAVKEPDDSEEVHALVDVEAIENLMEVVEAIIKEQVNTKGE